MVLLEEEHKNMMSDKRIEDEEVLCITEIREKHERLSLRCPPIVDGSSTKWMWDVDIGQVLLQMVQIESTAGYIIQKY